MDAAIDHLLDCGVQVVCVTCDSPTVQLSMMRILGADIDSAEPCLRICKDKPCPPIYFVHDMCHAIKLVRNAWQFRKSLKNDKGELIEWRYLVELYNVQSREGLKSANKLSHTHIYFHNNKMKVKYAVQLLSRSVALSLRFCREDLKLPQFQGSEATEEFILYMNNIFDLLNSRCLFTRGSNLYTNAMSVENQQTWFPVMEETKKYLNGLTNTKGESLLRSDVRKTGFLGIFCNIHAVQKIFSDHVVNGDLKYLCTYKLSQDPLEHFFGLVRARFGRNNNPTPFQFKGMFRRILCGATDQIVKGSNVSLQDDTEMVAVIPTLTPLFRTIQKFHNHGILIINHC